MADKAVTTNKLVILALGTGLTSILSKLCVRKFENSIPKIWEYFNKPHEDGEDVHSDPHPVKLISSMTRGTTVGRLGQCGEDSYISLQ